MPRLEDPIQSIPQLWNQPFWVGKQHGLFLFTKIRSPSEPLSNRTCTILCLQCLLLCRRVQPSLGLPLITAITAVVLPSSGFAVGVLLLSCTSLLLLDDISMPSSALLSVKGLLNVAGLLGVARLSGIVELGRIAGSLKVSGLLSIAVLQRITGLLSVAGWATSWLLMVFWLLPIFLLLPNSEGLALIWLGRVNLERLMAFSKLNPNFLVLPNPIFYLLSESPLSLWQFLDLWEAFLRAFFNLSNFLLNQANNCFTWLGFLPAFLAVRKLAFTIPSFLYLWQSLEACVVCAPPFFLHSLQDLSKWTFLGTCFVAPVLGRLAPALFLFWEAFLPNCTWASWGYIRAQ